MLTTHRRKWVLNALLVLVAEAVRVGWLDLGGVLGVTSIYTYDFLHATIDTSCH
jgi:hypothetical protein